MNISEALSYLYNLGYELSVKKFGLENTFKLLEALNNPEKNFLKVQIAGTNGKGSVCAFLDAVCVSANIKTGLYTSPHLISVTERIKTNGAQISESDFARHATKIREISEDLVKRNVLDALPTFFEQVTAIALSYFAEEKVEIAILETGLGGRFDSATATNAEIVAITSIDYDHQHILGNSLTEIASEKAAIIREDTKVIIAPQKKEAERVIVGKCLEKGVEPVWATTDFKIKKDSNLLIATFKTSVNNYPNVLLSLAGRHQFENASVAIGVAETLRESGFEIPQSAVIAGLENARHQGRLEFYKGILFDGAHNISGAKALREYLDEFIAQPVTMIFGSMQDKDLTEIGALLFPKAEKLILTKPYNPRAAETAELMRFLPAEYDQRNVFAVESVKGALEKAREVSAPGNLLCVTGSLYLVGEAQKILGG
jgi:dihydrofolate synthase / folylpolyglutamate synthase